MYLKGLYFPESEISFKKCFKELENVCEEKDISVSCEGLLKHCHFTCHFLIANDHIFNFFGAKAMPGRTCPHTWLLMDIVIITCVLLTATEGFAPEMQLTTGSTLPYRASAMVLAEFGIVLRDCLSLGTILGMS